MRLNEHSRRVFHVFPNGVCVSIPRTSPPSEFFSVSPPSPHSLRVLFQSHCLPLTRLEHILQHLLFRVVYYYRTDNMSNCHLECSHCLPLARLEHMFHVQGGRRRGRQCVMRKPSSPTASLSQSATPSI